MRRRARVYAPPRMSLPSFKYFLQKYSSTSKYDTRITYEHEKQLQRSADLSIHTAVVLLAKGVLYNKQDNMHTEDFIPHFRIQTIPRPKHSILLVLLTAEEVTPPVASWVISTSINIVFICCCR